MSDVIDWLGVQSFCFRGFEDNAKVAELVREIGLRRIELCRAHVGFDDPAQHEPAIEAYRRAGVEIDAVGVEKIDVEPEKLENLFAFAHKAGARVISCDYRPGMTDEQQERATELARKHGIRLAIHVHGGHHWLGNSQILAHVFEKARARGDETLGLCLDTAWALHARQDPVKMAADFADRLFDVHIKDFVFDRAGKGEDVIVGEGNLDLPGLLAQLREGGFDGPCVLEYEADVNDPVPALERCVKAVRAAMPD